MAHYETTLPQVWKVLRAHGGLVRVKPLYSSIYRYFQWIETIYEMWSQASSTEMCQGPRALRYQIVLNP